MDSYSQGFNQRSRRIRAPRGPQLRARSWQAEAPLRMLMNNLDPEVAEDPANLVVYGGIGKAYITALGGPGPVSDAIIATNFPALAATNTVGAAVQGGGPGRGFNVSVNGVRPSKLRDHLRRLSLRQQVLHPRDFLHRKDRELMNRTTMERQTIKWLCGLLAAPAIAVTTAIAADKAGSVTPNSLASLRTAGPAYTPARSPVVAGRGAAAAAAGAGSTTATAPGVGAGAGSSTGAAGCAAGISSAAASCPVFVTGSCAGSASVSPLTSMMATAPPGASATMSASSSPMRRLRSITQ